MGLLRFCFSGFSLRFFEDMRPESVFGSLPSFSASLLLFLYICPGDRKNNPQTSVRIPRSQFWGYLGAFIFPNHCLPFLLLCFSSFIFAQVTERITPKLLFGFQNSNSGVIWARSFSPIIAFLFCFFASLHLYLPS